MARQRALPGNLRIRLADARIVANPAAFTTPCRWRRPPNDELFDGTDGLDDAIALGAALRFRSARISNARVRAIFKRLLASPPEGSNWVVVDRRTRAPISVEAAPVEISLASRTPKAPLVFIPSPSGSASGLNDHAQRLSIAPRSTAGSAPS